MPGHFEYKMFVSKCLTFKFNNKVMLEGVTCQFMTGTLGSSELKCWSLAVIQRHLCAVLLSNPILSFVAC